MYEVQQIFVVAWWSENVEVNNQENFPASDLNN